MSIAVDYDKITRECARRVILEELVLQASESLASPYFDLALRRSAIYQDLPWVNQQIEYLRNLGAVTVLSVDDDVKIATLTDHGKRHLNRDIAIQGVERPRRPGAM